MASLSEILALARELSPTDRERLAREVAAAGRPELAQLGTVSPRAPHSVAWLKAERGHAVLATDTGPADVEIPPGAAAIAGMWRDMGASAP